MQALINNMQFDFDWCGVTIVRVKTEQQNCYYFLDRFGDRVQQDCNCWVSEREAFRQIKKTLTYYLKNHWVTSKY